MPPTIKATEPETPAAFGLVPVAALVAVQEKSPEPNAAKPAEAASAKPDAKSEGKPAKALEASATEVDEKQLAALVLERQFAALDDAVSDFRKWLMENPHEVTHWQKLGKSRSLNEIPYEKPRYTEQMGKVFAQKAKFLADVKKLETELEGDLFNIKPLADQQKLTVLDQPATWLSKFDRFLTYSLLAIGVCLMVGLFSRVAALGGAFFLLSVIGTQPPFVLDALPVYEQTIELLALLVIAATATGKWAGLDYFLGRVCGCCCGSKGNCDAT